MYPLFQTVKTEDTGGGFFIISFKFKQTHILIENPTRATFFAKTPEK